MIARTALACVVLRRMRRVRGRNHALHVSFGRCAKVSAGRLIQVVVTLGGGVKSGDCQGNAEISEFGSILSASAWLSSSWTTLRNLERLSSRLSALANPLSASEISALDGFVKYYSSSSEECVDHEDRCT